MQKYRLGEQGLSMLSTSGCSQLGLCSHGMGGQPLCLPAAHGRVLGTRLPACCHALSAGPGTCGDSQALAIARKTLRLKLPELRRNQHVLPSPEGTDRKTSEHFLSSSFAQRRLVELSPPQAVKHVRAQPCAELGVPAAGPPPQHSPISLSEL